MTTPAVVPAAGSILVAYAAVTTYFSPISPSLALNLEISGQGMAIRTIRLLLEFLHLD